MSGVLSLAGALAYLASRADVLSASMDRAGKATKEASADVDEATRAVREATPEIEQSVQRQISIVAGGSAEMLEHVKTLTEIGRETEGEYQTIIKRLSAYGNDLFDFGGKSLEEFVTNQRGLIEQIEGTAFGGYLDAWVKTYIQLQRTDLDARIRADMGVQLDELMNWIRRLTGEAGQKLDFGRLRQDIDDALKQMRDGLTKTVDDVTGRNTGSSSGSLGKPKTQPCGGGPSLGVMRWSGGLR